MLVPNRNVSFDNTDYRYGFQGQEQDDELKGSGNSINYTFRMHDPRVGRFFSVDPLASKYPYFSVYSFSGNRVVDMIELEGLEPSEPPKSEGETKVAIDQTAVSNRQIYLSDVIKSLFGIREGNNLYKTWVGHMGTPTTVAGWHLEANYKQIVMPYAIDAASFSGWSVGTTWQSAKELIGNPGPEGPISENLQYFLTSRVFDGENGNPIDWLSQIGAHAINTHNKNLYSSATGQTESMEFSSPLFGLGLAYKAVFTEAKSIKFSSLAESGTIDPFYVRYSQNSIKPTFSNGNSVLDVSKISEDIPAIRIVEKDGLIFTLDNRRLRLYQEAHKKIKYQKLDEIPKRELFKFSTENSGKTIKIRGN